MKKAFFAILLSLVTLNSNPNPIITADTLRIDGKLVLWLRGNHYENGWNYGFLLGGKIMYMYNNYVINSAFGGAANYSMARQLFNQHFIVDEKYNEISQGMIEGIAASGVSLFCPALNDYLTYKDVLIANSIPDFSSFSEQWKDIGPGCSNLTSWGNATLNDPELAGETVISRNLDWVNNATLINNPIIIVWGTAGPDEQRWISFGFIGLIGALSGFNEAGVVTFQNMGNYSTTPLGTGFYPVNLAQRNGLEMQDYNGDGVCSPRDVSDAVRDHNVSGTFIIHTAGPAYFDPPAEILEIHNSFGDTIRTTLENPEFFGDNLVATNHFRLLKPPAYCSRYSRISDSLEKSNLISIQRNWSILTTAGVTTNLQTIQYIPYLHIVRFSFAEIGSPAYLNDPTEVWTDSLFTLVGIGEKPAENNLISVSPNPCSGQTSILLQFSGAESCKCYITTLNGLRVKDFGTIRVENSNHSLKWDSENYHDGIYFIVVEFSGTQQNKIRIVTQKIAVIH
jgi:hypothetical protein